MKRVYGFVRVSTEIQKEKDNSIKNQISHVEDYCKRYDFDLVNIFSDNGISGMKKDRNGLMKLFNNLKQDKIDCLVVYSLSRLGRKLSDVLEFIELLEKNKVEFVSIKENIDMSNPVGKLMLGLLGSVNQFEVGILSQRISDVKQYKKSRNEVYTGKILYGKYKRKNKLVSNHYELRVLKLIKKLREVESLSYQKISNYLNDNDINSKEKCQWYSSSVRSVYLNGVLNN